MFDERYKKIIDKCNNCQFTIEYTLCKDIHVLKLYKEEKDTASFSYSSKEIFEIYEKALEFITSYEQLNEIEDWKESSKIEKAFEDKKMNFLLKRINPIINNERLMKKIKKYYLDNGFSLRDNLEITLAMLLENIYTMNSIKDIEFDSSMSIYSYYKNNSIVEIRPCEDKYQGKTYLGVLLGNFPQSVKGKIDNGILKISANMHNPLIYIFETNSLVFGSDSFWRKIKNVEDLNNITEDEITNTWYIKLLKEILQKKD